MLQLKGHITVILFTCCPYREIKRDGTRNAWRDIKRTLHLRNIANGSKQDGVSIYQIFLQNSPTESEKYYLVYRGINDCSQSDNTYLKTRWMRHFPSWIYKLRRHSTAIFGLLDFCLSTIIQFSPASLKQLFLLLWCDCKGSNGHRHLN